MYTKRFLAIATISAITLSSLGAPISALASNNSQYQNNNDHQTHSGYENSDRDADHKSKPKFGSIRVCKVILNNDWSVAGASAQGVTFTIPGISLETTKGHPAGLLPDTVIYTPIEKNTRILSWSDENDSFCRTYYGLPFGHYYYGEEEISDPWGWETPVYHDVVGDMVYTFDWFAYYSGQLFDADPGNDYDAYHSSNGHIEISKDDPDRTLVVINRVKDQPQEPQIETGSLKIKKYTCADGTTATRQEHGPTNDGSHTVPSGCTVTEGVKFGYIYESARSHGDLTDPYPGWDDGAPWTLIGATDAQGELIINGLHITGRYNISELRADGSHLPEDPDMTIGFYCTGDTGRSDDNYDITFISPNQTSYCVVYNGSPFGQGGSNNGNNVGASGGTSGGNNAGNNSGGSSGSAGNTSSGASAGGTSGSIASGVSSAAPQGQVLGTSTCGAYLNSYLRYGYQNDSEEVKKLQTFLNSYMGSNLAVDGNFNLETEKAVRTFQLKQFKNVLEPWKIGHSTGIVYLTTRTEINNIQCPALNLPIPEPLINWSQNPVTASIPRI